MSTSGGSHDDIPGLIYATPYRCSPLGFEQRVLFREFRRVDDTTVTLIQIQQKDLDRLDGAYSVGTPQEVVQELARAAAAICKEYGIDPLALSFDDE